MPRLARGSSPTEWSVSPPSPTESGAIAPEAADGDRGHWAGPIGARDARVAHLARTILNPGWLSGALLLIRARESNDIRRTIQVLNRVEAPDLGVMEAREREERAAGQ